MDPRHQEALVQRLISNPHDQAAIAEAHSAGQQDPEAYGKLLERVGLGTPEPALASHWLNEAANVWMTTFNDAGRAVEALLQALDRDPGGETAYSRLQELYRASTDADQATLLLERRAYAFANQVTQDPSLVPSAVAALKDVARRTEKADPKRSRAALGKALALEPNDALAIYNLREAHKTAGEFGEALPLFAAELALESDPERRKALTFDEAEVAKRAGQSDAGFDALGRLLGEEPDDVVLKAQVASWLLEVHRAGTSVAPAHKERAARLFVDLAEVYPGEHGLAYSMCALELAPGDDRAVQLAMYYAEQLHRVPEVVGLAAGYLAANPNGVMASQARQVAGDVRAPAAVTSPSGPAPSHAASSHASPSHRTPPAGGHESVDDLLERADSLAKKSRKNEAIATYRQVLDVDPTNADALVYLAEQLPLKRKYAELRDVLMNAALAPNAVFEDRGRWLREAADLCENQLRDLEGAITAWQRLVSVEPDNHAAYDQLRRLLERAKRWDELAAVLANEAENTEDVEARIAIERNLARVHSEHRKDTASAGAAWARIAGLSPGDEDALSEAVRLFETAQRPDLAADALAKHVAVVDDVVAKRDLYIKLGDLRAAQGQTREGGEALAEGAAELRDVMLWARAEHYFVHAKAWEQGSNAADEQERLTEASDEKAKLLARSASYLLQMNERDEAVARLERAVDLAPTVDEYSTALEQQLIAAGRVGEVATLFLTRADRLTEVAARVALRKRAAKVQRDHLQDIVSARASYVMVLRDAADPETLLWLANDAEQRKDVDGAVNYLTRLVDAEPETTAKVEYALREAKLRARGLSDVESGVARLHYILDSLDENNEPAMTEIADLEQSRGKYPEAASILERQFKATKSDETRLEVAARLGELYERRLNQPFEAIRVLSFVHDADPGDFDATQRLCHLAEENEKWDLVAELMQELVAVEGDAEEASRMNRRLAVVFSEKLGRGEQGLRVLAEAGERGDAACREAFVELGDKLDKPAEVARNLVSWYKPSAPSAERSDALLAAFERFVKSQSDAEAIDVAKELGKGDAATPEVGQTLEPIALRAKDLEALRLAHGLRVADLGAEERAAELVRQAEVLVTADVSPEEAIAHGETGLGGIAPPEAESLLARIAALTSDVNSKVAVYERQIARCTTPETALPALCRAAEVAMELGDPEQAGSFFQLAFTGALPEEGLAQIVELVRAMDKRRGAEPASSLRLVLAEALAAGGQDARDGGKTRSRMLRRAAKLAAFELRDIDRAIGWIGDALTKFVEEDSLTTLNDIAASHGDYQVAEQVATRALGEVFDGPMVRELLRYRADLRQDQLDNLAGAAEDLRRLHDLNPADFEVNSRLATMYEELGDYIGMVKLYEDQILRSRDQALRAELARTVAKLWQNKLNDPRETADAWRRVLRFNAADEEAKQGLAKAKAEMLQARPAESSVMPPPVVEAPPPPIVGVSPVSLGIDDVPPPAVPPLPAIPAVAAPEPPLVAAPTVADATDPEPPLPEDVDVDAEDVTGLVPPVQEVALADDGGLDDDVVEAAGGVHAEEDWHNGDAQHAFGEDESDAAGLSEDDDESDGDRGEKAEATEEQAIDAHAADGSEDGETNLAEPAGDEAEGAAEPDADLDSPWSEDEVRVSREPQPDPFAAVMPPADLEVDDAELIDEIDEVEGDSELDALVPARSVAAPPSRRVPGASTDLPKPPPPPSLAPRKD